MKRYLWLSFLFWCVCGAVNAAVITQVDPPSVQFGETFHLTLTIDDAQTRGMPDLTPLQHDFIIMGTERSMKYTIVNGQANSVSQWSVL